MNPSERTRLIDELLDGVITEADFLRLEAELQIDPAARREYFERTTLSVLLETEAAKTRPPATPARPPATPARPRRRWVVLAGAGPAVVLLVALTLRPSAVRPMALAVADPPAEEQAAGFGVVAGQRDAVWAGLPSFADRALLPAGSLRLVSGVAQVELFSGVSLVVEGDAEFIVRSPMEVSVSRGKVRAQVPPPAQGFRLVTREGEVIDRGTEFAVDVRDDRSEVHVLTGEVDWRPTDNPTRRMTTGQAVSWSAGRGTDMPARGDGFVGFDRLREQLTADRTARRDRWAAWTEQRKDDPRLVALYHTGGADPRSRRWPNAVARPEAASEGAIVAAGRADDRWGRPGAVDFSPAGSRVRLTVPGTLHSLTLVTWVRIHSLDRWYNSLFLTDGHDEHEPHWQIMDDGRLFFSVKKRDRFDLSKGEKDKHVYYSPPFWTKSMSGRWLMLATTYDLTARRVTHYLDGAVLSREEMPEEYVVPDVVIGPASLGNWGMPERDEPRFAVRNLNGGMDEFALYAAALTDDEVQALYEAGKP